MGSYQNIFVAGLCFLIMIFLLWLFNRFEQSAEGNLTRDLANLRRELLSRLTAEQANFLFQMEFAYESGDASKITLNRNVFVRSFGRQDVGGTPIYTNYIAKLNEIYYSRLGHSTFVRILNNSRD